MCALCGRPLAAPAGGHKGRSYRSATTKLNIGDPFGDTEVFPTQGSLHGGLGFLEGRENRKDLIHPSVLH